MNVTYVFQSSEKASAGKNGDAAPLGDILPSSEVMKDRPEHVGANGASSTPANLKPPPDPSEQPLLLRDQARSFDDSVQKYPDDASAAASVIALKDTPAPAPETATYGAPAVQKHNLPVKWVPPHSRLILVARSRGGMGATSLAVNLAIELQDRRGLFSASPQRKVALVDLDVQFGTAGSILDVEDRGGLLALTRMADEPDAQAVRNALVTHQSGLKILPAPQKAIPLDALDGLRVGAIIDGLMAQNDYVVVDLPPALVYWLEPLLQRADRLLMMTDLAVPSVTSARRLIDLMREDNPELKVDIVVSRERKPLFQRELHRSVASALGEPLRHWLPDETRLSRQALDRGEPLVETSPRCPWSRAVRDLARDIDLSVKATNICKKDQA
jgi:MinD-like ATPase involved in chromosome partitioning or flagellar assembly